MATYPGGKNGSGTYQQIINKIPHHDFYFEGFAGSAAIHRLMARSTNAILCDVSSSQLVTLKSMVRPGVIVSNFDTISRIVFIVNFLNFLSDAGRKVFAYFDPPYLFDTRSSKKKIYQHEIYTADHIAFLSGLVPARFNCMVSCYDSTLYSSMLESWNKHSFQSTTRKGSKTETIYFNYPVPNVLHDYSYIGSDFREREQFSRIRKNFLSKLNQMPDHLRNSIIQQIKSMYG